MNDPDHSFGRARGASSSVGETGAAVPRARFLRPETDLRPRRRTARKDRNPSDQAAGPNWRGIRAYRIPSEEMQEFNYHVRQTRGELLFARCWLLVVGQSESWIFPADSRAMKIDLHREGIRVVEYSQSDAGQLAKIANALGIFWYCVGDRDDGENNTKTKLMEHLDGAKEEDRMIFPYEKIEVNLLSNWYEEVYEELMPRQNKDRIESTPGQPNYWSEYAKNFPPKRKTRAAAAAAAVEMETQDEDQITNEIRDILDKVKSLARGS